MSTFKPTQFNTEINVTKKHPLKEVSWLIGSVIAIITATYLFFNALIILLIPYVSIETENDIWAILHFTSIIESEQSEKKHAQKQEYLQTLLDSLPSNVKPKGYDFKIHVVDEGGEINAFALPGGHIVITTELLNNIHNENALTYIIAHELGHFAHRHHLKSMGLFAGTTLISVVLLGSPDTASSFISSFISMASLANSRSDEIESDIWAIEAIHKHYGHVGGAFDLFKVTENARLIGIPEIFSTHPLDQKRIDYMSKKIKDKNYTTKALKKLPWTNETKQDTQKLINE